MAVLMTQKNIERDKDLVQLFIIKHDGDKKYSLPLSNRIKNILYSEFLE